jgi:hypothetical protein
MPQIKPEWEELPEFNKLAVKLIEKHEKLRQYCQQIDLQLDSVVAYVCTNKPRPEGRGKIYDLSAEKDPISRTNSKSYFVLLFQDDWVARSEAGRAKIVISALLRIDPDSPSKVRPLDYKDQHTMLKAFGVDWFDTDDGPNPLTDEIEFDIPDQKESEE